LYKIIKKSYCILSQSSNLTPKLAKYLKTADKIYTKIKPYLPTKNKTEETKYIRGKGINVKFRDKIKYPSFVIENTDISFKTSDSKWQLIAKDITNDQTLLNKHTTAKLTGISPYFTNLQANIDYYKIAKLNATVLNLKTGIKIMPIVKKVTLNGTISGTLQKPIIKLKSNLDKILANYLKTRINKEINKQKAKLNSLLNKKLQNELKDINLKDLDLANMDLNNYNKTLDSFKNKLEKYGKKELEKKIMGNGLNKLKSLF
jgi:methyl-accepting chemotaxis protein